MKDQASLNLLIVDSPIDSKALTGHLMLRATSTGLKVYDATGSETELGGGGTSKITVGEGLSGTGTASSPLNLNIANYTSQSTISLSSTEGSVNLAGYNSVNLQETFGNKLTLAERGVVITTASGADVLLNEHASNSPNGFAILDSTGKLPASIIPETAGSVDLSAYNGLVGITTTGVSSISNGASGEYKFTLGINSNGVILTEMGSTRTVTVRSMKTIYLEGGEIAMSGYPFKIHSNGKLELSSSQDNIILNAQNSVDANIEMHGTGILWNGAALNTPHGLVQLGSDGKIPSGLYEAGSGEDTSALEERVTTLEGTVGTLDAAVDEILADYGEGSGALVYRVVASATEPENPTEGMIWIQTE